MFPQPPNTDQTGDFSLLNPVDVPAGLTAGPWQVDDDGRPTRRLSDGSTQRLDGSINTYPVDSATRTCCGGIGTHTHECLESASALGLAVQALVEVRKIVQQLPERWDLKAKIDLATREVAQLGDVPMCDIKWCGNKNPAHKEHHFSSTFTMKGGHDHLDVGASVDMSGDYDNEIAFRAWFTDDDVTDSVSAYLTVEQAREVISTIELAIERRAELRGAK